MAAQDTIHSPARRDDTSNGRTDASSFGDSARRLFTETKAAFKTTEFAMTVAVVVLILISAMVIKGGDSSGGTDEFVAKQAWLYVAIVTGAYAISRGLAKSGTAAPYSDDDHSQNRR